MTSSINITIIINFYIVYNAHNSKNKKQILLSWPNNHVHLKSALCLSGE